MKKSIYFIGMFLIISLVMSVFVYAAGTGEVPSDSTNYDSSNNDNAESDTTTNSNPSPAERKMKKDKEENIDCDSKSTRLERIKCRIKNKIQEEGETIDYEKRVPEACRTLKNPTACIALYKNVRSCYKLEGREKNRCFKRAAGFAKVKLGEEIEGRAQKARQYMVTLLYELEERIEKANEEGKITDEKSAEIIDLIVAIKEDILEGKKKAEILPKLNSLKKKIKEVRSKTENTGGEK